MMSKKDGKITKLINSVPELIINRRFLAKLSIFDNGVDKKSILLCVKDLLTSEFTIKFLKSEYEAENYLKLLKLV